MVGTMNRRVTPSDLDEPEHLGRIEAGQQDVHPAETGEVVG
jgi:hypothetical protein